MTTESAAQETTQTHVWMGVPVNQLSREELLEVVDWLANELRRVEADRDRWARGGDVLNYLRNGK